MSRPAAILNDWTDSQDVAVLTGGVSEAELREAGTVSGFESVAALRADIASTPLA